MPIIHARGAKSGLYEKEIVDLYASESLDDNKTAQVLDILDNIKAMDYCQGLVENYALQVGRDIKTVGFSEESDTEFKELIDFLVTRDY